MARRKRGGMAVKRRGPWARVLLALALCALCLVGWGGWKGFRAILSSDLMTLRYIEVEGCRVLPQTLVEESLESLLGRPLHTLDPDSLRSVVEKLPRVARASVKRKLPGTLAVRIEEQEAALLLLDGGFKEISGTGELLPRFGGPPPDLPILRPDSKVPLDSLAPLAIDALAALRLNGFDVGREVSEIGVDPRGIVYTRSETETRVILGWNEFEARTRSYQRVYAEIEVDGFPKELDLRFRDQVVAR